MNQSEVFAPRYRDYPTDVDPDDDLTRESITPFWPSEDWAQFALRRPSYDRRSDTLFMRFSDERRPILNVQGKSDAHILAASPTMRYGVSDKTCGPPGSLPSRSSGAGIVSSLTGGGAARIPSRPS